MVYTLKNNSGFEVKFSSFGGKIMSIMAPDRHAKYENVVIGYANEAEYQTQDPYIGAICGRFANRIANGRFILDGRTYQLPVNLPPNHVHGGDKGFHTREWEVKQVDIPGRASAYKLSIISNNNDNGYPGKLQVDIHYSLTNDNEFIIEYRAVTDKDTVVNLTVHPYFNLHGNEKNNVLSHQLMVYANNYTPLNSHSIPNLGIQSVRKTAFDFTSLKTLREALNVSNDEQINQVGGIDHNFVLDKPVNDMGPAATLLETSNGRVLQVFTTQPGLQVYVGLHFDSKYTGYSGTKHGKYCGVALEAQHFPDSPNQQLFPDTTLRPGQEYQHTCVYKFLVD